MTRSEAIKKLWENPEYRQHMSKAHKGFKQSVEQIQKKIASRKGYKHTFETIEKIRLGNIGNIPYIKGKTYAEVGRKVKTNGKNHYRWIENRTQLLEKHRLRGSQEWKIWRGEVFERDLYTCRECGIKGCYLEPHHITPIRSDMSQIFEVNNGITLCRPCHQKTMWKESNFAEHFSALVAAH